MGIAITIWFLLVVVWLVALWKGPALIDRIVIWDFFSILLVVFFLMIAVYWNEPYWVDVAVILSGVAFISTTMWVRYALTQRISSQR